MNRQSLLTTACCLSLLLAGLVYAQATEEMNPAPQSATQSGAPPEAILSPPPDSEKVEPTEGFTEVTNPAFPVPAKPVETVAVQRGKRFDLADLAPYFAEGKLAEAKAEFDRGRYGKARMLLAGETETLPLRYLKALSALRLEDWTTAAAEFPPIAEEYLPLRDRCLVHAGTASEQLKNYDDAAAMYEEVEPGSKMYPEARLGLARVLHRAKRSKDAIASLAAVAAQPAPGWGRDLAAEALLLTADIARDIKDSAAELAALHALWGRHPLSPLAAQAETRLKAIKKSKLPIEAQVWRAEALVDAHRNKQGIVIVEPLLPGLKLPDPLACRAHFIHGKALRKERKHTLAVRALSPVTDKCTDPDLRARAMYVLGSSRSIVDQTTGALTYEQLAAEFPTHSFADDALFYAADLHVKTGALDEALKRLQEVVAKYPSGDFAAEAYFKTFWIHRVQGKTDEALAVLDQIRKQFKEAEESYDYERATYWLARMKEEADKALALKLLEELAVDHPATYYGLISRDRLEKLDGDAFSKVTAQLQFPETSAPVWPLYAGPLGEDPHFKAGIELYRMGLSEAVTSELLAANRTNQPAEAIRLLVQILSLTGDERAAHAVARVSLRKDLSGRITDENRAVWEVAYPNAFRPLIESHCKTAKIEPDLLQALMREESALDPKALSWAGALGLTQLMPSTARQVARSLKLKPPSTAALLEPDLNIKLGAAYLGSLIGQWKGNKFYAVGSYNAGPRMVTRWKDDRPTLEIDEWVEEIPIAETRGYIKRVLRSYNTYRLLYGKSALANTVSQAK